MSPSAPEYFLAALNVPKLLVLSKTDTQNFKLSSNLHPSFIECSDRKKCLRDCVILLKTFNCVALSVWFSSWYTQDK